MRILKSLMYVSFTVVLLFACSNDRNVIEDKKIKGEHKQKVTKIFKKHLPQPIKETVKISVAGDFTIGSDESFGYSNTFIHEADRNGLEFFIKNVKDLFSQDDFTSVNLETTLTTTKQKASKKFRFKGDPSYTKILSDGSIEAVNLANNHTYDYLQKGYEDTIANLKKYKIGYFGRNDKLLTTVKGIKIGALGYEG